MTLLLADYDRVKIVQFIFKKYPEGHFLGMWMGLGIAIFSVIEISLSIITENPRFISIGPALGVAVGLAIGQSIENKYKNEGGIRPPI